jgi:NAD-specific glutamate dehydrogenase
VRGSRSAEQRSPTAPTRYRRGRRHLSTYLAAAAFFRLDHIAGAARGIVISDYFDRLALDRAFDSIGDAELRLTAAMAGNGAAGPQAVEAWVAPRQAEPVPELNRRRPI